MAPERWRQIEQLYHAALERAPGERESFLDEACPADGELRREIESLLAFDEPGDGFIEAPPDDIAAGIIAEEQARSILGSTLGHYKLQSLLGAGGMGEVYRARDLRLDREVAVKILPEHMAQEAEALRRFEREAKAVAALSHPNILAIHDFGVEQGLNYAVMELLEGKTLRARLMRGQIGWREAVEIGSAIAEGLAAAHAKGIIHRDLKPENIFLTSDGQVKILDFGIARVKHVVSPDAETLTNGIETTKHGMVMGTIGYMPPEQLRGERADAPSDIFSLGCVLYEMISGERPFARVTTAEMIAAILKEDPRPLAEAAPGIPEGLTRAVRRCLEKRAADRFQSARDLAHDLKSLQGGVEITKSKVATAKPRFSNTAWIGSAAVGAIVALMAWLFLIGGRDAAIDSLAILPLVNVVESADVEYLSDGITETIINNLSQLPRLRVMARSTVFNYKGKQVDPRQVGRELNVKAVFIGKMQMRGGTLSIQADLVNAADGSQLWGERYDSKLSDLLTVQDQIARQISEKLRLRLTGAEQRRLAKHHTESIEAHQLYLKGRYYWNKFDEKGLKTSVELFKKAIDLDPNYALAYAGLADSYYFMSNTYLPSREAMPMSQAAAMKALQIDESLAEAHAAMAAVKTWYDWEWEEGERAYKRAIELNPGYASVHNLYGVLLVTLERFDEAQGEMNRAYELDPLSPYIHVGAVWPVLFSRRYDQAIEQLQLIVALNPDFNSAQVNLGWAYEWKGRRDEAITAYDKALTLDKLWFTYASLGYSYAKAGKTDEARKILAQLQEKARREYVPPYGFAIVHAGLGENDQAFAALENSFAARDEYMSYIKIYPFFDGLRSDPRFTDLLRRMRLTP